MLYATSTKPEKKDENVKESSGTIKSTILQVIIVLTIMILVVIPYLKEEKVKMDMYLEVNHSLVDFIVDYIWWQMDYDRFSKAYKNINENNILTLMENIKEDIKVQKDIDIEDVNVIKYIGVFEDEITNAITNYTCFSVEYNINFEDEKFAGTPIDLCPERIYLRLFIRRF